MTLTRRYELVRAIGSGGMAQVFEAWAISDSGFKRKVAIKRIHPEHSDDDRMRASFFDEARVASGLHHGNIVQVVDWGLVDGSEFIAMEFVDGVDASAAARRGRRIGRPMDEGVALYIGSEIAHALDYLHQYETEGGDTAKIVHRDVSPHNILLSWDGAVKLSDFGIAFTEIRDHRTATGVVKGKASFMAPEQARAEPVGPPVDVFSFGATLHALIAGESPVRSTDGLVQFLAGAALEIDESISPEVAGLIRRCMAFDPNARPTARDLALECGRLVAQRSLGDGRSALQAFLAAVRPSVDKTSALDQVMGLCIVPASEGDRAYTVTQEAATTTTQELSPEKARPGVHRNRGGIAAGVATVALITGVGFYFVSISDSSTSASDAGTLVAASADASFGDELDAGSEYDGGEDAGVDAGDEPVVDSGVADSGVILRHLLAPGLERLLRLRDAGATQSGLTEEPPVRGEGWLRVGGPALAGARVWVDGALRGHAPLELRLPAGAHHVVVRRGDGTSVLSTGVAIRPEHTRRRPARVIQ